MVSARGAAPPRLRRACALPLARPPAAATRRNAGGGGLLARRPPAPSSESLALWAKRYALSSHRPPRVACRSCLALASPRLRRWLRPAAPLLAMAIGRCGSLGRPRPRRFSLPQPPARPSPVSLLSARPSGFRGVPLCLASLAPAVAPGLRLSSGRLLPLRLGGGASFAAGRPRSLGLGHAASACAAPGRCPQRGKVGALSGAYKKKRPAPPPGRGRMPP